MRIVFEVIRALAALLVAPVVAATLFIGLEWVSNPAWPRIDPGDLSFLWPVTFIVALAHAVALGLPAFLVLGWLGWTRWWVSLVCGFAIGCLPFAIYFLSVRQCGVVQPGRRLGPDRERRHHAGGLDRFCRKRRRARPVGDGRRHRRLADLVRARAGILGSRIGSGARLATLRMATAGSGFSRPLLIQSPAAARAREQDANPDRL
jgi:hypothetical protein